MISAFGIEHTEGFSKAALFRMYKVPQGGRRVTRAQKATAQSAHSTTKSRPKRIRETMDKVGEANVSLNSIGRAAGRGLSGAGRLVAAHPGVTGTALVGGGGAASYGYLSSKEPKRKSS